MNQVKEPRVFGVPFVYAIALFFSNVFGFAAVSIIGIWPMAFILSLTIVLVFVLRIVHKDKENDYLQDLITFVIYRAGKPLARDLILNKRFK